ncbi:lysophospholipid acyltransferase family protein [Sneathiella glossodoripedis]|uniref:lysophospholipid acyltransferase family protein n=1 Tax=Sneathiella glossodoripedis TaxID=418853 RepID=UPI0018FFC199|nr:lysophospholipid acyltransferase family protein [Sneathiella glossodoripedis]
MNRILQRLFFAIIVRPVVYVLLGLNVRDWQKLPRNGPAILVANHNSHLDTLVLMSLFPLSSLPRLRPVAAADYFFANFFTKWFATNIIGIIPIHRNGESGSPLEGCFEAIDSGDILILFPEGSRGEPEKGLGEFKRGVQILAEKRQNLRVYPVLLHGLGKFS